MSSRILARFERHVLEAEHAAIRNRAIGEANPDTNATRPDREGATPGNEALLRGIPLFVPGVRIGGAIRGTRPEAEALRLDGLRRRRA
jgi:hypothetical protein